MVNGGDAALRVASDGTHLEREAHAALDEALHAFCIDTFGPAQECSRRVLVTERPAGSLPAAASTVWPVSSATPAASASPPSNALSRFSVRAGASASRAFVHASRHAPPSAQSAETPRLRVGARVGESGASASTSASTAGSSFASAASSSRRLSAARRTGAKRARLVQSIAARRTRGKRAIRRENGGVGGGVRRRARSRPQGHKAIVSKLTMTTSGR